MKRAGVGIATAVLAVSMAGAALTGCSETDDLSGKLTKAQYVLEMKALVAQVQRESRLAAKLLSLDSLAEAAPVIGEVVERFDEIAVRMEEIEPPEEVAAVHVALASALSSAGDLLTDVKGAVESNDIASLLLLAPQLADFRDQFRGIVEDYEAEGYSLAEPAGEPATSSP